MVLCNTINDSESSLAFLEDNSGSKFRHNIFTGAGSSSSPNIYVDGIIDPFQGNASQPANNRFETVQQVLDIEVALNSTSFSYYFTNSGSPGNNPFFPRGNSNYFKVQSPGSGVLDCSTGRSPGSGIKEQDVLAAQSQYENIKNSADPKIPQEEQQVEDAKVNRDNLLNDFVDLALKEQNLSKINSLLSQIPGPEAKIRHFGACLEMGDHGGASSILSAIGGLGNAYNDFVSVQNINLGRLQSNGQEYILAEVDSTILDNIARSESNARGYARAILYLLKRETYYNSSNENSAGGFQVGVKTTIVKDKKPSLLVYPNPIINGRFKVTGEIIQGDGKVIVRRMDGSILSVNSFADVQELSINSPKERGIYFVEVTNGNEIATTKIVVKQ